MKLPDLNTNALSIPKRYKGAPDAMTLIEMIGVLAVIAVLAGVMLPVAIRILDRIASEREVATLARLGETFTGAILRTRQIPTADQWANFMATETGMDVASVTQNARRVPRVVLFDKGGWFSTNLPYAQTNFSPPGLSAPPVNARAIIVSSLGAALPSTLNSTVATAADFSNLWNTADYSVPTTGPWAGWGGRPDDVRIQRINLAPLFANVVLSSYLTTNLGLYKIDNYPVTNAAPQGFGVSRYLLKGTQLQLFSREASMVLQHSEILSSDVSFVYEAGQWRSSIVGAAATGLGDISGIVEAFLKAPGNMNATYTNPAKHQQFVIVTNFIAYMSNYNMWEDSAFKDTALKDYLDNTLQAEMMEAIQGLYKYGGGADNHYPTNNTDPCVPILTP